MSFRIHTIPHVLILAMARTCCVWATNCTVPSWSPGTTVKLKLSYADSSGLTADAAAQRTLDIYYTSAAEVTGAAPVPLAIYLHGGGWRRGSSDDITFDIIPLDFRLYGISVASISYRLSQHATFPAQIDDAVAAVSWLREHAAEHHVDPERFILYGTSAGAQLATLLGAAHSNASSVGRVAAVIDFFGPADLRGDPNRDMASMLGCATTACPEKAAVASSITHVDAANPPLLGIYGTGDPNVDWRQGESFIAAARAAGADATFMKVDGAIHDFGSVMDARRAFELTPEDGAAPANQTEVILKWLQRRGLLLGCEEFLRKLPPMAAATSLPPPAAANSSQPPAAANSARCSGFASACLVLASFQLAINFF
mmetsp:Transcript_7760/g.28404  ORF Transcript_7760/g.28404 Transcript_7760/m.28404 type:complete len:370 (+) Transcript_7760:41-1150(+)